MLPAVAVRWPSDDVETIEPGSADDFRSWLAANHRDASAVWLMYWKKGSGRPSLSWPDAVDEALCYGWIDTKVQSVDDDRYVQYFAPRRPRSVWSRINKEKVERLVVEGRMTDAGLAVIDRAKADGSWTVLDAAEALIVPDDLAAALDAAQGARDFYESLTKSGKLAILGWIYTAKRPETRAKRVAETARSAAEGVNPRGV